MAKRGVVIVGSGLIARFHAQAVNASEKLELKGFCDLFSIDSAKKAAAEFGGEAWGDYKSAFTSPGVGMVTVATASGGHDEAVFAAAEHKLPVIVEKPLSISTKRIDAMIDACKKAGVQLGCILQTRWEEKFAEAKRKIEAGEIGKLTYAGVRVPWWREDEYYTKSSWHGTWAVDGGGALINQSIHMVDWLVALMPPVVDVKAFAATLAHPMETEDTVSAALKFEGGALGGVYAATSSFPGRGKTMEITGTKGTIEFSDEENGKSRPDQFPFTGHLKCFDAFADSLEGGAPYPIPGEEARKSVALIEAIYKSAGIWPEGK
jgi:predicted dehydrogenase